MKNILISLAVIILCNFIAVPFSLAATLAISSEFRSLNVGDIFTVEVFVNTENQVINAAEAKIIFPSDVLEFVSADDGSSVVSLWVQKPTYDGFGGITFSGVTPGGFTGDEVTLLRLKFKTISEGQGIIQSESSRLLLHDGMGTEARIEKQNLHVTVKNGESSIKVNTVDSEEPESFSPQIIQDKDIYGGSSVLIFATKDKGSGIDSILVKEGFWGSYKKADSPYRIDDQSLSKKIYIKAIDKMGNERIEIVYPQNWQPGNEQLGLIVSILTVCVLFLVVILKLCYRYRLRR